MSNREIDEIKEAAWKEFELKGEITSDTASKLLEVVEFLHASVDL